MILLFVRLRFFFNESAIKFNMNLVLKCLCLRQQHYCSILNSGKQRNLCIVLLEIIY